MYIDHTYGMLFRLLTTHTACPHIQPGKHTIIGPMLALYWRVPFVPATVQTVLSQYTGHTVIKVDVLACIGPALARLYRPSIGAIPANFNIVTQVVAGEVLRGAT